MGGIEAEHFLENLVTCAVTNLEAGDARFGALLTPQGKILYDFHLARKDEEFLIDIDSSMAEEFSKRLMFYRLRAKVEINQDGPMDVFAYWGNSKPQQENFLADTRHQGLGYRCYGNVPDGLTPGDYEALRVELNIPMGGVDFEYGGAYPHETLMDQFEGVDFRKGCYVGQEVVSRMQHRGTAKKRIVGIEAAGSLPETGTPINADGKPCGVVGTTNENRGLALLRLDRAMRAQALVADETSITAHLPDWVTFGWPEAAK